MLAALGVACALTFTSDRPRLVLVISIDQFRADYVRRFQPWYLPANANGKVGGFRYLSETGAYYVDAHHAHVPTATGPGHAAILTGSAACLDGIISNDWFDRTSGKPMYCVDDKSVETVGGTSKPMSPRNLLTTTVGDELKLATNGKSKVVGVSFKDRAAILMAGHAADTVVWLDSGTQNFVSSSFYCPDKRLPGWVQQLNGQRVIAADIGKTWEPLLPDSAYGFTRRTPGQAAAPGGKVFSHKISKVSSFTTSSFGQEYVFEAVKRAVEGEHLGQDDVPDVLAVNLATNDYVGHAYGPDSPEVMDISVRTDRLLSDLFNYLNKRVVGGLSNVAIALTADHGVGVVPEEAHDAYRIDAERHADGSVTKAINKALSEAYGDGNYVLAETEPNLYLDDNLISSKKLDLAEVRAKAAAAAEATPGIYAAFTYEQLEGGRLPKWPWVQMVSYGFNPKRAGDLMVFSNPGDLFGDTTASHGTPWAYDSHVPLLLHGPWFHAGRYARHVLVMDLASTLCQVLNIEYTSGNMGQPLYEAIDSGR